MKKIVWMSLILSVVMLLTPLAVLGKETELVEANINSIVDTSAKQEDVPEDTFRILNHETGKISEMSASDYIFGVVAAEMPALYEVEAIKAQAVAAYTYACYSRKTSTQKDYDLSTDFNVSQSFVSDENLEKKWGSKTEEYTEKIKSAINDSKGYLIKYNGEIILSVYHAISSGKTEDCENVWGKAYPYLQSVDSSFDTEAENYKTIAEFSAKELKEKLGDKINSKTKPKKYFGDVSLSKTGLVKEIEICGNKYKGSEVRELLNLRSSNFSVDYKNEKFIFTVKGYGHGVGMSQYGANAMAKQGKSFKEILLHYYTDCTVEK